MAMNPDDVIKYKSLYLQTSWGYLNMLRRNVSFLLRGTQMQNAVEAAHLAAHSLKSQSILMGYGQIGELSGKMEQIFRISKEQNIFPENQILELMLETLKKVQISLTQISENGTEVDMSEEIKSLETNLKSE